MPQRLPSGEPPRPAGTPDDVHITWEARRPETDPAVGIHVDATAGPQPKHRLVTIGDSLTQGFQSLAIYNTALSWPKLVADQLGLSPDEFRFPTFDDGYGGLPLNLEVLIRGLQQKFDRLDPENEPAAAMWLLWYLHEVKHWWTHHAGSGGATQAGPNHNLSVYSYDVQSACTRTLAEIQQSISAPLQGLFHPTVPHDVDRAAQRVLQGAPDADMSLVDVAAAHGRDGGIETLVVTLGANDVLDVVVNLQYEWSSDESNRQHGRVWSPSLFRADWETLMTKVRQIDARHVILGTVPHVTVAPLFSAAGNRLREDSRYFEHYTHYWLAGLFHPARDPKLTGAEARAIDSAIDQYNDLIVETVREARGAGRDWYVLEMAGLLDRLAYRRYLSNPAAEPSWWAEVGGPYPLPAPLAALHPQPDTRFFAADSTGRTGGGLIALDGVHPTTVGYGIVAQEVVKVMQLAGVRFPGPAGGTIDFAALLAKDTLMSDPPRTVTGDFRILGWLNEHIDMLKALVRHR